MQFLLVLSLEEVAQLPPSLLAGLRNKLLSEQPPQQQEQPAVYQQPQQQFQPPAAYQQPQAAYQQPQQPQQPAALPAGFMPAQSLPAKSPMQTGPNTQVFAPSLGHVTQQNSSKDVMTGAVGAGEPVANVPHIPQFNNAPASVGPTPTSGVAPAQQATADRATVQRYAVALRQQNKTAFDAAVASSQLGSLSALTDANAGHFYQHLLAATR